jgi:serine/threonine protein phosphatase 1
MLLRNVTGNHDTWSGYWFEMFGKETVRSFQVSAPEEIPVRYLKLLGSMKLMATEADFVLVHAGLNFLADDPMTKSSPFHCLWSEAGSPEKAKLGGRTLVTGHAIRTLDQIGESLGSPQIFLDNGAFTNRKPDYGNLVAMNLDQRKLIVQPWVDS